MQRIPAVAVAVCIVAALGSIEAQQPAPVIVVLVRHAERASAPPDDPGLSDAGRARAEALAEALEHARVDAVITTQYERTRRTAEPLARGRQLTPVIIRAGADTAAHVREVATAVRLQPPGSFVLVVGHSNTVPAIVGALGGPTLPDLCDAEYATLFALVLPADGAPRLVRSSYGAPDPPEPCGRTMIR
jgi:broad specificity phosphatase PhoE